MFGFSLPKLLFTVVVIALVIYGFKWIGRLQRDRDAALAKRRNAKTEDKSGGTPAAADEVEDMIKCRTCGAYVPASGAVSCGREDCPFPG